MHSHQPTRLGCKWQTAAVTYWVGVITALSSRCSKPRHGYAPLMCVVWCGVGLVRQEKERKLAEDELEKDRKKLRIVTKKQEKLLYCR